MKLKSYTDLSQSKKLADILPLETADMHYNNLSVRGVNYVDSHHADLMPYMDAVKTLSGYSNVNPLFKVIPCWSLSALLGLMPKLYELENDPDDAGCQPNLCKGWDNNLWHIVYRSSIYITEWYDNPLDAAFELVCWLKAEKYI